MSVGKGESAEKELAEIFTAEGLTVIRIPLSGRMQPLPDIIVVRKGVIYGFEVKFSAKEKARFSEPNYDNLLEWLIMFRKEGIPARGFLAVKINDEWQFIEIDIHTKEVYFPNPNSMSLQEMIKLLKRRSRAKQLDCTIRLMGKKEDVYKVARILEEAFKKKGYRWQAREYVMYKDKKERTEIDTSKTRIYARISKEDKR